MIALLVNGARLRAAVDLRKDGLVEVDTADLHFAGFAGLGNTLNRTDGVKVGGGEDGVDIGMLQQVGLNGLGHGSHVAFGGCRQRKGIGLAARLGDAFAEALAISFDVGRTRQRVDANAALAASLAEVVTTGNTSLVVDCTDIVHRSETVCRLDTAGVVDNKRDAGCFNGFERRIHGVRHPVGGHYGVGLLVDRLTDEFGSINTKIVVVLGAEPDDLAALCRDDLAGIFGTALHDRPERIVRLAADHEDICSV